MVSRRRTIHVRLNGKCQISDQDNCCLLELEQSDVKEIIHDVLQELQARESNVSKTGTKKD
jgi:hypothetical protein